MSGRPLAGRCVVVTRAGDQAGLLREQLTTLGADVIDAPTIAIVDPDDAGRALRDAMAARHRYDWLVVTSPNGARRVVGALDGGSLDVPVAVVGPGTAAALAGAGVAPALVPQRFVAEGLLAAFPAPTAGRTGRVLVAQAAEARTVLADGLRAAGWAVEVVVAYRTVPVGVDEARRAAIASADAITFASGSAVSAFVAAYGVSGVPPVVVCIGPITVSVTTEHGLIVTRMADPHTIDGLVAAVVDALADQTPA